MRSLLVRIGASRRVSMLAVAVSFVMMMSGCASSGGQPAPPEAVMALAGVTADHGLDPGSRITVGSGMSEDRGNVTIDCPADTPACVVVVGVDGSVGYDPAGGVPAIVPRPPAPDAVEHLLPRRLLDSTWRVAHSFGGWRNTCDAIGCPVHDYIHVYRPPRAGGARPSPLGPVLSGFERLEPRRGIALASKAQTAVEGQNSEFFRAFGAWMDHGFFVVEAYYYEDAGLSNTPPGFLHWWRTEWYGDASHSGPLTSPGDTATWSGVMSGVEASPSHAPGAFVHGDSAITISGLAAGVEVSVEVAFTNIVNEDTGAGIGDMVWRGLPLQGREFGADDVLFWLGGYYRDGTFGTATEGSIYGRLHGPGHEEVGGLFHRNGVAGAFAGKRDR